MITHLLVDYGEVLSTPHAPAAIDELARLSRLPHDELVRRYWEHRPAYDRGQPSADYWSAVLGRPLRPDDPLLAALVTTDIDGWLGLNEDTLQVLLDAHRPGLQLALMSNAPHPLAAALEQAGWAGAFAHLIFSCRLGVAKPEAAAFERALTILGVAAEAILFIDDRPANIEAAARIGLATHRFTSAAQLASTLHQRVLKEGKHSDAEDYWAAFVRRSVAGDLIRSRGGRGQR